MEWYNEVSCEYEINQGDIFFDFPITVQSEDLDYNYVDFTNINSFSKIAFKTRLIDMIILTQSCDIVNNPPIDNIVIAEIFDVKGNSKNFLRDILTNRRPPYHLLGKKDYGDLLINYHYVDFTSLFTVSKKFIDTFKLTQDKRIRLNSPYLELLSQRFGNFFSRIGLPESKGIDKEDLLNNAN